MLDGLYLSEERDEPLRFLIRLGNWTYLRQKQGFRLCLTSLGDRPKTRWVPASLPQLFFRVDSRGFSRVTFFSVDLMSPFLFLFLLGCGLILFAP